MLRINERPDGISFKVYVQPKSSKNTITGLHGDALKIRLTAPPVDNAANRLCIKYLAKCLEVPKSALEILSGHTGRNKLLLLKFSTETPDKAAISRIKKKIESLIK
ncbi:MAG: YggU family protein [Desulfobacteraceae bacterium 4572_123]|nr:MAG: YggU family protein [Desulfobacteraceae bacterium 4572_123]